MTARVLYRDSQGRDGSVMLDPGQPCYVGRALDCAIRTDDAMVSRKHSMIRMENGRFYVEDLGSSNGTHVNDVRVTKQFLSHNDVVRCGSLWLRYVEDVAAVPVAATVPPMAGHQAMAGVGAPKKGGTRRLDAPDGGGQAAYAAPGPTIQPPVASHAPYQAVGHAATIAPGAGYAPVPPAPFGGPPPMPAQHGEVVGNDRRGAPAVTAREEDSVVVEMGVDPAEHDKVRHERRALHARVEELQAAYDREAADGKRLRAETQTLRDRIEEHRKAIADKQEAIDQQERVAEELREETRQAKDEVVIARMQMAELSETVAARDRQLQRTHEDIGKLKDHIEDLEKQLADVSRTKDEGWKRLNEQLTEIDNLREVVNEQERMLEERRVGLVSQEETINELRKAKEQFTIERAQLRAERDELRADAGRAAAQIAAIDEENKRLTRLLTEMQTRITGGRVSDTDQAARFADELKNLRVELRTVESDRDRLDEMYERAEAEVERLQQIVAKYEVDVRDWHDKTERATGNKAVAEEALAKAEVARHKAQEEGIELQRQRDEATLAADQAKRELDRARRRIDELEGRKRMGLPNQPAGDAANEPGLQAALIRVRELEEALSALRSAQLRESPEDDTAVLAAHPGSQTAIRVRAVEVHDAINDVLSELRSNILLIQGEFADMAKGDSGDSARIIKEAIEALVASAEDAKGALRTLRELADQESGR